YREIESIELNRKNVSAVGLNDDIDLKGLNLKVRYADGETSNIEVDTDMISAYDKIEPGKKDITVNYAGIHTLLEASFDESINKIRDSIFEAIAEKDYDYVRKNIGKVSYPLTFSEIRTIDHDLKDRNGRNYVIKDEDETRNISISGLDLSLPDRKSFSFVEDTYYVIVDDIRKYDEKKITDLASGYGFEPVKGLDISFRFNYQTVELEGPAIVQIAIEDKKNDLIYSVYHLNKDGDIVKCRTTQSDNYIQFMIEESGAYEVLSLPSVNEFDFEDQTEDLSYENMGTDNHRINFSLMFIVTLALLGIIGIIVYYIISNLKRKTWKDFKKSLRTAESVQEEKPKN
ncbi:MAG: bacterial Ig-like domain-containing protein, partial [Erysipelotrichaceae bacterium]|nr:bacterial Ig-like domain-containing protein [Erysipelotrichaceae bacterium]